MPHDQLLIMHTCWQLCICSVSLPWYTLDWLSWSVYLRQDLTCTSCTRQILSHKGLQELSVSPLDIFPFLITVILSLFHFLLLMTKIFNRIPALNWIMYHCMLLRNEVRTDCMAMDVLPKCYHVHDHWSHFIYNSVLTTVIKEMVNVISIIVYQI